MRQRSVRQVRQVSENGKSDAVVKTTTTQGMRQMRCTACGNMCAPGRNAAGAEVLECTCCHKQYGSTKF